MEPTTRLELVTCRLRTRHLTVGPVHNQQYSLCWWRLSRAIWAYLAAI
jgi:hypothetical protein